MKHIICATLKHWLALTVVPAEILGEKILELSRKKKKKQKAKHKTQRQLRFAKSPDACFIFVPCSCSTVL